MWSWMTLVVWMQLHRSVFLKFKNYKDEATLRLFFCLFSIRDN